jgi:DNA-binding IclR family transcriptional regulator
MPVPPISSPSAVADKAAARPDGIQVISRAAAILRSLADNPRGLSLGEIAKAVQLPRSTVQRIVDALDSEGLVLSGALTGGVRLGPALLPLAAGARFEIAEVIRPHLEELAKACGETVDLALFDHDKAVFIDQVQGSHRLRAVSAVGVSFPLHCSSNGKAMLAELPPEKLKRLRKSLALTANTANSITDWDRLDGELAEIRRTGIAYDREEQSIGISAAGTAIKSSQGELIAVTIAAPTQRFHELEAQLCQLLLECRGKLHRILTGTA